MPNGDPESGIVSAVTLATSSSGQDTSETPRNVQIRNQRKRSPAAVPIWAPFPWLTLGRLMTGVVVLILVVVIATVPIVLLVPSSNAGNDTATKTTPTTPKTKGNVTDIVSDSGSTPSNTNANSVSTPSPTASSSSSPTVDVTDEPLVWSQLGQNLDGPSGDLKHFGYDVALSEDGQYFWVGGIGILQLFRKVVDSRNVYGWEQAADLSQMYDSPVQALAVSKSDPETGRFSLIAGAPFFHNNVGVARVFAQDPNTNEWIQRGEPIYGDYNLDFAGYDVSMDGSGTRVAIGADQKEIGNGYVKVLDYEVNDNKWVVQYVISGNDINAICGKSVALTHDGSRLFMGALYGNTDRQSYIGSAQLYHLIPGTSKTFLIHKIDDNTKPGEQGDSFFGNKIAMSADGSMLAAGSWAGSYSKVHTRVVSKNPLNEQNATTDRYVPLGDEVVQVNPDTEFSMGLEFSQDGSIMVIGAPRADTVGLVENGAAFVYRTNSKKNSVTLAAIIPGQVSGELMGGQFSLSGDAKTLALAALWNNAKGYGSGQARVYWVNSSESAYPTISLSPSTSISPSSSPTLTPIYLSQYGPDIDGPDVDNKFGISSAVSRDGRYVCAGGTGTLRLYESVVASDGERAWEPTADLSDMFDSTVLSVAMSDADPIDGSPTIVVGTPYTNDNSGAVFVLAKKGPDAADEWATRGDPLRGAEQDRFGQDVAVDGDGARVAVAASQTQQQFTGYVRVLDYDADANTWTAQYEVHGNAIGFCGMSAALSRDGDLLFTYAAYPNQERQTWVGAVWLFRLVPSSNDVSVVYRMEDHTSPPDAGDYLFGMHMAMSDDASVLIAGSPNSDYVKIHAKATHDDGNGTVVEWYEPFGEETVYGFPGTQFGTSVAASPDGSFVAVGAPAHDGGHEDAGVSFLYALDASENSVSVVGEVRGRSVGDGVGYGSMSFSGDSTMLVTSSAFRDANGLRDSGQVYVYWTNVTSDDDGGYGYA